MQWPEQGKQRAPSTSCFHGLATSVTLPPATRREVLCMVTTAKGMNKKNVLGSDHTNQHSTLRLQRASQRKNYKNLCQRKT